MVGKSKIRRFYCLACLKFVPCHVRQFIWPYDPEQRKKWCHSLHVDETEVTSAKKHPRICGDHFYPKQLPTRQGVSISWNVVPRRNGRGRRKEGKKGMRQEHQSKPADSDYAYPETKPSTSSVVPILASDLLNNGNCFEDEEWETKPNRSSIFGNEDSKSSLQLPEPNFAQINSNTSNGSNRAASSNDPINLKYQAERIKIEPGEYTATQSSVSGYVGPNTFQPINEFSMPFDSASAEISTYFASAEQARRSSWSSDRGFHSTGIGISNSRVSTCSAEMSYSQKQTERIPKVILLDVEKPHFSTFSAGMTTSDLRNTVSRRSKQRWRWQDLPKVDIMKLPSPLTPTVTLAENWSLSSGTRCGSTGTPMNEKSREAANMQAEPYTSEEELEDFDYAVSEDDKQSEYQPSEEEISSDDEHISSDEDLSSDEEERRAKEAEKRKRCKPHIPTSKGVWIRQRCLVPGCQTLKVKKCKPTSERTVVRNPETAAELLKKEVHMHTFPKDPDLRKKWLQRLQIQPEVFEKKVNARICDKHFKKSDFGRMRRGRCLKPGAIPQKWRKPVSKRVEEKVEAEFGRKDVKKEGKSGKKRRKSTKNQGNDPEFGEKTHSETEKAEHSLKISSTEGAI